MNHIEKFNEIKRNYTVDASISMSTIAKQVATELGYDKIRYISSGSYGDCWKVTHGNDVKVLKITTDMQEAKIAERIRKISHSNHIISYYDVRRINPHKGEERIFKRYDIYSILMDYITPLEKHPDYYLIDSIIIFQGEVGGNTINKMHIESKLFEFGYDLDEKSNYWINQLKETFEALKKIGIQPTDADIHSGNLGYSSDNILVYFDISTFDFSWLKLKKITLK